VKHRGRNTNAFIRFLFGQLMAIIPHFSTYSSTPKKSARVIIRTLTDESGKTGVYFDEKGQSMLGSAQVWDPEGTTIIKFAAVKQLVMFL
jgi:hypothetical protein